MVPPLPSNKAAWQWAEITKPEEVSLNHVLTAYRMNLNFCNSCRKNVKGNPCCLSGLGEKIWLSNSSPVDDSDLLREKNSYVGLKNLGATCYANAFLQVWFHMPEIRNAVFSWNSLGVGDDAYSSICQIISCLQEVFGFLYFSKRRFIDPTILLNYLSLDSTVQQDAQEFSKLFMSKLEEIPSHGRSIFHDFVGRYDYVTSCTKCGNQTRSRSEFYELDLNVINNKKLSSCLDEFLQQEILDGDNQFFCSTCNMKQNATRCIELVQLPDTLNLQLLRFVYDKEKQSKKKISSPLTFPETLDMSPYVKQNAPSRGSPDENLTYDLFAILIHSGQLASSGHYIAVIRDYKTSSTFQFNDEKVIKLEGELSGYDLDNAVEEGALIPDKDNSNNNKTKKPKTNKEMSLVNAYMLVYRRRNAAVNISEDIPFENLPSNLKQKITRHDEELKREILNESKKLASIHQKQENIKLLYSTILSYEGCSAEVKSEMFEFVPAQNLRKFFQLSGTNDNNRTTGGQTDNDMETNVENDDNDNDISAINYNCGREYEKFFCKHKKLNPDEVTHLKLLPSSVVDIISNQLGLTKRLPCSEVLCKECVIKKCSDVNAKMALNEDGKKINIIMKSKQYQPTGFLVGKESWKNWRKKAERNLFLDCEEAMETDQPMRDVKDDPNSSDMFNSDLLCSHGQLDPNEQNWKNVSYDIWQILRKYFPSCPEFPCGSLCCSICEDKSQQEQMDQDESKHQALLLRQLLNDLYLNRKRPSLTTLRKHQSHLNNSRKSKVDKSVSAEPMRSDQETSAIVISDDDQMPNQIPSDLELQNEVMDAEESDIQGIERLPKDQLKYFLASSMFIDGWKKCCKDATKHKMPHSVCNGLLVCCHGKLLFDPWDAEQSSEINRQFVLLWPEEWDILKSYVNVVDQEIYVEIAEVKSKGMYFAISIPELCVECLEEKRKKEMNSKFHYEKAKIYVYRLDEYDSDLFVNPTNQTCGMPQNISKVDDKSRKRKSDEETSLLQDKHARLECSAAIRRSGRRSKNRGEKEIVVSSKMTLRQLHFEIFNHFQVFKTNQVLYMDGKELVGDDLTLEKLCVPPEAVIRLEVHEDLEEHFVSNVVGGSSVEEGFKGTGLVG